jgi:AGCS family alanine or glycine:cation symporter
MLAARGGIGLVGTICSWIIPVFFTLYYSMGLWVCAMNYDKIPQMFADVFYYAFTPHASLGGVAGGWIITSSQGIRRGCYSSDVGVGYASVIHSESSTHRPETQASLANVDIFLDAFLICTMRMVLVLLTGHWQDSIDATHLVQTALADYFPYMHIFMPVFLVLLGYSTVIAYFCVGHKAAEFLGGSKARTVYNLGACISLFLFSFVTTSQALTVMSITQLCLVAVNLLGIYRLRNELSYDVIAPESFTEVDSPRSAELLANSRP